VLILTVRVAIHQLPWFGPWLADTLRSMVGAEAVTWLEELSSDIEDNCNRLFRSRSRPRSLEQAQPPPNETHTEILETGPERSAEPGAERSVSTSVMSAQWMLASPGGRMVSGAESSTLRDREKLKHAGSGD
jgi:hypothetical protein